MNGFRLRALPPGSGTVAERVRKFKRAATAEFLGYSVHLSLSGEVGVVGPVILKALGVAEGWEMTIATNGPSRPLGRTGKFSEDYLLDQVGCCVDGVA